MRRQMMLVLVMAIVLVVMASPVFAHGVERYEHAHGQSAVPVTLYLPAAVENSVHGDVTGGEPHH
jgi:hypothetical protein